MRIVLVFSLLVVFESFAQGTSNSNLSNMPQEAVYIQKNESLVFSGENFLYKFYCLDRATRTLSHISQVGYVALVNQENDIVFSHKLNLKQGVGYGDFFVPTSIPTGSYKLIGYSEWMKNLPIDQFFQSDLYIVNPYQPVPASYLEEPMDSLDSLAAATMPKRPILSNRPVEKESTYVDVALSALQVGKREQVNVQINAKGSTAATGNYAISVRKLDSLPLPTTMSPEIFVREQLRNTSSARSSASQLPELRGDVISGTITLKETGNPVEGQRISLSLPGEKYLLNVATSDANGKFRFIVDREYDNTVAALQLFAENWDEYEVTLDEGNLTFNTLEFSEFKLTQEMEQHILKKSIQNQIENAFREVKLDSVIPADHSIPFYRKYTEVYNLDDYTRFNSIPETIIEVVDQVGIRRLDNGNRVFEVRPEEGFTDRSVLPMVFVDGLFIKKHEDIMGFSAKKVKSISFAREKVLLGPQTFQGIVAIETIEGDFYSDFYTPHIINVDLFKPESRKEYHNQNYGEANVARIPDFRHQLFWETNIDLSEGSSEINFYTSDVPGTYLLVLEGFTSNGNPVSVKKQFVVN